ncbi:MAG: HEAT repeat domain-containing protein [Acidobacteria bacterium]|nr:HEAT repeat domain-containing protein [Acidobacteriota bacterium]
MARPAAVSRALIAFACLIAASCKSVPAPEVVVVPEHTVSRDTKLGWIVRLEQQRQLRDPGSAAADVPGPARFRSASEPALDALAVDPDPVVRRRAVLALGRIALPNVVPALIASLQDPEEAVRATAAFALGLIGPDARDAVVALQTALADPSLVVRARAIDALGLIGSASAVPAIYQAAAGCSARIATLEPDDEAPKAPEIEVCRAALFAFVRLQSYDAIAGVALDGRGQPVSRWWPVAYALQRIADRRAVPALSALAGTPGIYTAGFALRGLAAFKEPSLVAVAKGLAARRDADVKVRVAAVRALGQVGGREAAVPLIELLDAPGAPPVLILETITALGATQYAPAFDALLDYVSDAAPAVRAAALTAAAHVAPDAFLVVLASLEPDKDWSVRAALARVLGTLSPDLVRTAVDDFAKDADARVRAAALETLAVVKPPDLGARLLTALQAADFVERATAARLIGEIELEGAVPHLVTAYDRGQSDAAYSARAAALGALAAYGSDEARTILRRGLGDREWPVRWRTAELLRGLGDATAAPERPARLRQPAEWFGSDALLHPAFSPHVFIETRAGTIEAELDMTDAAATSLNFIELARAGFFDGMKLHRVVPAFVVQGGDPRGDGEGGPGYTIPDELNATRYVRGTLGMALDWRDTGGSQFFVTLSPQPHLDGKYTAFGRVVDGWPVLDELAPWDVVQRVRVWDGVEFR